MIIDPTGVPTLDRLNAFIGTYRSRMDNNNTNLFAASAGAWWRYYEFLIIILARYDRSNAEYVEAQKQWIQLAMRPEAAGRSRPVTPEDIVAVNHMAALMTVLHLDIETFYLFAKILLDRIADTFGLAFEVKWKSSGSSYSDLSKQFADDFIRKRGLEIRPDNLPTLTSKLWEAVVTYRNKMIEHLDGPLMWGTLASPGQSSSIAAGARQTEDPHALFRMLEEYIEAMPFFEANATKSPLIVS